VSITHPDYPDERLVVCRKALLADERQRKREALPAATEKLLAKVKAKVDRKRNPLRGESEIGVEVGAVVNSKKVAKHFRIEIDDDRFEYSRDQGRVSTGFTPFAATSTRPRCRTNKSSVTTRT